MNGEPHCREDLPGPALVEVPAPTGSLLTSYCMDATEVSAAHYAEFLAAAVPTSGQLSKCSWNTSFDDGATPLPAVDGGLGDPQPAPAGNMPMRNVDWCDAYAYCDWAGKRLCGALAGTGTNEWEHACSAGNEQRFPYGNTYQPLACNGFDNTGSGSVPVGSIPECEGGYPGLFDLSGNVWEWQFPCMGSGENVVCEYRGGSYTTELEGPLRCDVPLTESIMLRGDIGIRCCADLVQ
jgi:formylglycine-generating enzyme required for sulfatase activity